MIYILNFIYFDYSTAPNIKANICVILNLLWEINFFSKIEYKISTKN
jgi:hypothetical protein